MKRTQIGEPRLEEAGGPCPSLTGLGKLHNTAKARAILAEARKAG
jgi:hypothetical protein